MTFDEILAQVLALLQREGRVSYRALKRRFALDDNYIADLKDEIIEAKQVARDERGTVLAWTGASTAATDAPQPTAARDAASHTPPTVHPSRRDVSPAQTVQPIPLPMAQAAPGAERRQLTVLFCDLVGATGRASQLEPEDLHEIVQTYQQTCAKAIARCEGYIAQYLGDGLLVYFGYPLAHEDDAQRAVGTALGIVEAVGQLNIRLVQERGVSLPVRLGIHTGLVVVGEVGSGARQELLALGETPNLAARLQGLAAFNTVVLSAATLPLLGGFFVCQSLGLRHIKGLSQPLEIYQVECESMARGRLEAAGSRGLTPLVGRRQEIGLLRER
jgi:class 3 adenylate cyclase